MCGFGRMGMRELLWDGIALHLFRWSGLRVRTRMGDRLMELAGLLRMISRQHQNAESKMYCICTRRGNWRRWEGLMVDIFPAQC